MTTALRSKPTARDWAPNDSSTHLPNPNSDIEDTDMTITFTVPSDRIDPSIDPLAPDSPTEVAEPPGFEQDLDDSLAARAPVARCADGNGTMAGLFFSDHVVDIARAKAMCALCPLAIDCLNGALEREEPWGVWGGELISGGRIVANKRPCGRPPKTPRPEVVYDEMGPVGLDLTA
ncbi:WhiB family transcriptional regulator [Ilumatobacter coccineus]|jgi:WhiB family transcriptional regulator, redox-sensing transcriptional regulator|uniref:Putative WhiB family transcriptional regulator n=1 Tax=Ilumatobacter coccineus (strain NBRC 103263 / KCTC 29153 / YM16-304) TaxID=1313172 RepID=A0A6C7E934_ILUCY|nr:WhiB family transcriptional regulator [Ilumatobacter coccineus]BAN04164.1 putative WhiB family transcriptional regulator [Ilumatobacter coccineus YM16-304]